MGNNTSNIQNSTLSTNAIAVATDVITTTANNTDVISSSSNVISLQAAGDITITNCTVSSEIKTNININTFLTAVNSIDTVNDIVNSIQNSATATLEQELSGLNVAQTNISNTVNQTRIENETSIQNAITNAVENTMKISTLSSNRLEIITGGNLTCLDSELTLETAFDIVATAIVESVFDSLVLNEAAQELVNTYEAEVVQSADGISTLAIILIIVGGLALIGGVVFLLKKLKVF